MYTTNLRKVGGSVMMLVPPSVLEMLDLRAGAEVGMVVEGRKLLVDPHPQQKYALEQLLAEQKIARKSVPDDAQWLDNAPRGKELL